MFLNHSELCFADILFVICMLWKYLFLKFGFNLGANFDIYTGKS